MSEAERRRFAQEQPEKEGRADAPPEELDFDNPRGEHHTTKADLDDRDGTAALLDDRRHDQQVRRRRADRRRQEPKGTGDS